MGVGGVEVELIEHVEDAVGAERDAHSRHSGESEHTGEVVVATATGDAAYLHIVGFNFDDCTGVVVETASEAHIEIEWGSDAMSAFANKDRYGVLIFIQPA